MTSDIQTNLQFKKEIPGEELASEKKKSFFSISVLPTIAPDSVSFHFSSKSVRFIILYYCISFQPSVIISIFNYSINASDYEALLKRKQNKGRKESRKKGRRQEERKGKREERSSWLTLAVCSSSTLFSLVSSGMTFNI